MQPVFAVEGSATMNMIVFEVLNLILVGLEVLAFYLLSGSFFRSQHSRTYVFISCISVYVFAYVGIMPISQNIPLKLVMSCILFAILARVLYRAFIPSCFFMSLIYVSFVNVCDSLILFVFSSTSGKDMQGLLSTPYVYFLMAFFAKFLELTLITIVHSWGDRHFHIRQAHDEISYFKVLLFPLITLIVAITLFCTFMVYPETAPFVLLCVVALLVADLASIFLLDQLESQQQAILDNHILQQELKLANDNIVTLSEIYSTQRRLTHDFHNQLSVIQGLLHQSDSLPEAREYINRLLEQSYLPSLPISTHRIVADVILNQKYNKALQTNIQFQVDLDDLSILPLPDDALVVVLSNLLDNALEACEAIQDRSQRSIFVKIRVSPIESILCIENSVASPVKIVDNRIISTKKGGLMHGYGLQNIEAILNANGWSHTMSCSGGHFSFIAHFHKSSQSFAT